MPQIYKRKKEIKNREEKNTIEKEKKRQWKKKMKIREEINTIEKEKINQWNQKLVLWKEQQNW